MRKVLLYTDTRYKIKGQQTVEREKGTDIKGLHSTVGILYIILEGERIYGIRRKTVKLRGLLRKVLHNGQKKKKGQRKRTGGDVKSEVWGEILLQVLGKARKQGKEG